MFERFTEAARGVIVQAHQEARGLHHDYIGTEHLLLGLLSDDAGSPYAVLLNAGVSAPGVRAEIERRVGGPPSRLRAEDAEALRTIGIDLDQVLGRIEALFGSEALQPPTRRRRRGHGLRRRRECEGGGRLPFTDRAKRVLELSLREAHRLHHGEIRAEHLLLGLLGEGDGLASAIITDVGVDPEALRTSIYAALRRAA